MVQKSKSDEMTDEEFERQFKEYVLDKLDAKEILNEMGEDAILLCWEPPGEFCHRRIVAQWLESELGIKVPERLYSPPKGKQMKLFGPPH
jgi:uncharacterized protein (DUF488 family)